MKILVYSNIKKDINYSKTLEIINYLLTKEIDVVVSEKMYEQLSTYNVSCFHEIVASSIDLLIVLGGDGTFLSAAHEFEKYHIPFLGLNLGRVGYLTECDIENCFTIIDKVLNNEYSVSEKTLLEVQISTNDNYQKFNAFNEVVIHRGNSLKMLKFDVKVKDDFMDTFYADGVLVSTSMGSSAYNLSAGGPLLLENAKCFVITSICSQSGIMPSVVVSDEDLIEITAASKDESDYSISIDGKGQILVKNGTSVFISKATVTLPVISIKKKQKKMNHIIKAFNGYIK